MEYRLFKRKCNSIICLCVITILDLFIKPRMITKRLVSLSKRLLIIMKDYKVSLLIANKILFICVIYQNYYCNIVDFYLIANSKNNINRHQQAAILSEKSLDKII
jgi:hypothetical protein